MILAATGRAPVLHDPLVALEMVLLPRLCRHPATCCPGSGRPVLEHPGPGNPGPERLGPGRSLPLSREVYSLAGGVEFCLSLPRRNGPSSTVLPCQSLGYRHSIAVWLSLFFLCSLASCAYTTHPNTPEMCKIWLLASPHLFRSGDPVSDLLGRITGRMRRLSP